MDKLVLFDVRWGTAFPRLHVTGRENTHYLLKLNFKMVVVKFIAVVELNTDSLVEQLLGQKNYWNLFGELQQPDVDSLVSSAHPMCSFLTEWTHCHYSLIVGGTIIYSHHGKRTTISPCGGFVHALSNLRTFLLFYVYLSSVLQKVSPRTCKVHSHSGQFFFYVLVKQ